MAQTFTQVVLVCGVEGCEHGPTPAGKGIFEIAHPEKLDEIDFELLNKLIDEDPNQWEETPRKIVEDLLGGKIACPTHGWQYLGFSIEMVSDLDEDEGDPDWADSWGNP